MNPMAVAHPDEVGSVGRHTSVRNRQFSLYAARKAQSPPSPLPMPIELADRVPQLPQISPLPGPARWDSLSNGAHVMPLSPTSPRHPRPMSPHQPQPLSPSSRTFSYDVPGTMAPDMRMPDTRNEPPSRPLTAKSSLADIRAQDNVANFSRPRKQSIRLPTPETIKTHITTPPAPPADLLQDMPPVVSPQTPPWHQSSGPSLSSSPASILTGALPNPSSEYYDYRAPRVRNPTATSQPPVRPAFGARVDSSASAPAASGAPAPWLGGDEPRSSFRSQLTSSTAPGTAATERSSVLTKGSSVPSVYADPDEPSLEDVMGMYEKGFGDDDDNQDDDTDNENYFDSRPVTALTAPAVNIVDEEMSSPPIPPGSSNLDAEIRRSKMIFSSPAFISSVPHMANNYSYDYKLDKRDSAKSLDSEPSATSDPTNRNTTMTESASDSASVIVLGPPSVLTPEPTLDGADKAEATTAPTPSPPAPSSTPAVPPEEPGSRDRYGFKKQSQHVTRQQYDAWDNGYSDYLARRRKKWVAYLKDNALMTDRPNRFPSPNAKTKRFVRKGIPPDWRGAAWFYYAGGPAILAKHSGLYHKLLHKKAKSIDIEAIERDLHRTFPDNVKFKPTGDEETTSSRGSQSTMTGSSTDSDNKSAFGDTDNEPAMITSLRRVLYAFSVYNPKIGYCQSLNFIAGMLLLFVETEEQCFWLLNVITHIYLPGTHEISLEGSKVDLGVLMSELRDTMPAVWDKIGGELEAEPQSRPQTSKSMRKPMGRLRRKDLPGLSTERLPPITLCMTAWFMSCFIGTLPTETVLRVWDVFFYEGSKTMFRIALSIFKLGETEIRSVSDPMEMFGVVQAMPRRMLDANALMEACFKRRNGFGHLSQEVIEERRQERREKTQQDLRKTAEGVDVTEVEPEVRRKGTLFGKRRNASRTRTMPART